MVFQRIISRFPGRIRISGQPQRLFSPNCNPSAKFSDQSLKPLSQITQKRGFFAGNFSQLAPPSPPSEDSNTKNQEELLKISKAERTFISPIQTESTGSREIEHAMSGSQMFSAYFTLSDIDADAQVKMEKPSVGPSKGCMSSLHPKSSKKRKSNDAEDHLLDFNEVTSYGTQSLEQLIKFHKDELEDMRKMAAAKTVIMEMDTAEIARLRKEGQELRAELIYTKTQHTKEMEVFMMDVKKDAAIAIFQARIKMATEAIGKGFDASIWDLQTWKDKLAGLTGEDPEVVTGLGEGGSRAPVATMEDEKTVKENPLGDDGRGRKKFRI